MSCTIKCYAMTIYNDSFGCNWLRQLINVHSQGSGIPSLSYLLKQSPSCQHGTLLKMVQSELCQLLKVRELLPWYVPVISITHDCIRRITYNRKSRPTVGSNRLLSPAGQFGCSLAILMDTIPSTQVYMCLCIPNPAGIGICILFGLVCEYRTSQS